MICPSCDLAVDSSVFEDANIGEIIDCNICFEELRLKFSNEVPKKEILVLAY
jgi:hypothetical protein